MRHTIIQRTPTSPQIWSHRNAGRSLTSKALNKSWKGDFSCNSHQNPCVYSTLGVRSGLPALCPSQDLADLRQNLSICLPSGAHGALQCSARQEQIEVTPDTVKMFVPHMVAAHALIVSVPKWQVSLLLLMLAGSCLPNHTASSTAKLRAVCFQEILCSVQLICLGKNHIPHMPLEGFIANMLLDGSHNVAKHKLQVPFQTWTQACNSAPPSHQWALRGFPPQGWGDTKA